MEYGEQHLQKCPFFVDVKRGGKYICQGLVCWRRVGGDQADGSWAICWRGMALGARCRGGARCC
jgi:hypothetical protein